MADDINAATGDTGGAQGAADIAGAAPAAPATPEPALSILGGGGDPAPSDTGADPAPAPAWREDWREAFAGKDEKLLSRLKRFASPENVFKSYQELERKVSAGQLRPSLPDGATDEEIAAYRKTAGVPDKPEDYGLAFPDGAAVTDDHKAKLAAFAEAMHGMHAPPEFVKGAFAEYLKLEEAEAQRRHESVRDQTIQGVAELRSEYGRDFQRNIAIANQMFSDYGGDKAAELMQLPLADGRKLGDHPDFVRLAVNLALATAGDDEIVTAETGGGGPSIEQQYKDALALQNTDSRKYWGEDHQALLMKLRTALDARNNRQRAA